MSLHLFSKSIPAFGLDVSDGSIKLMYLGNKGKYNFIKACADIPLPKGIIRNDGIIDKKTFGSVLQQTLDKPSYGKVDTRFAVLSLPETKCFVRVIQIPQMNDTEAESAVPYEAESFIPLPIDQVYLDWQKIGISGDKMNVLLVAAPKEFVDGYLETFDQVGIKPVALEVESQSCLRSLAKPEAEETLLILDAHAYRSTMIMVESGNLQFTSSIPIAGNNFTESIAKALGISNAKAEDIKKKVGLANTPEYPNIKTAMLPVLNNLSEEINNVLKFHAEHSNKQVSKIVLAGGACRLQNLSQFLLDQLKNYGVSQVELANPWLNLNFPQAIPLDANESLSYATAIGLAMRGLNHQVSA